MAERATYLSYDGRNADVFERYASWDIGRRAITTDFYRILHTSCTSRESVASHVESGTLIFEKRSAKDGAASCLMFEF